LATDHKNSAPLTPHGINYCPFTALSSLEGAEGSERRVVNSMRGKWCRVFVLKRMQNVLVCPKRTHRY